MVDKSVSMEKRVGGEEEEEAEQELSTAPAAAGDDKEGEEEEEEEAEQELSTAPAAAGDDKEGEEEEEEEEEVPSLDRVEDGDEDLYRGVEDVDSSPASLEGTLVKAEGSCSLAPAVDLLSYSQREWRGNTTKSALIRKVSALHVSLHARDTDVELA
ncbi:hypothetical protein N1851_016814 [Merluccius polli]|uniref:Uncharacterized protein n=1 Tax=Merluccius polli TaxID=89951 RepID=A0AA47MR87_MERPO|nr:hypothetical protein N1851_016814 [Merluccius polli]